MIFPKLVTIKESLHVAGVGLHSGLYCDVTIRPRTVNPGIYAMLSGGDELLLENALVLRTPRCTRISDRQGHFVDTVEHLLSALRICGISSCILEFSSVEAPILNGASDLWAHEILSTGLTVLDDFAQPFYITKPIYYKDGSSAYWAEPALSFSVDAEIDFPGTAVGLQRVFVDEASLDTVLAARTFVLEKDVKALQAAGLALGGSLENALVIGQSGPINPSLHEAETECVRHKVLDFVGDLYTKGAPILGHFRIVKPGHSATSGFLSALTQNNLLQRISKNASQEAA